MGLKYKCMAGEPGFTKGETYETQAIVSEATVMFLNDEGKLVALDVPVLNDDARFELVLDKEPEPAAAPQAPAPKPEVKADPVNVDLQKDGDQKQESEGT